MDSTGILGRYYLAMAAPFLIDLVSLVAYAIANRAPETLLPAVGAAVALEIVGIGICASFLIRPVLHFTAGQVPF